MYAFLFTVGCVLVSVAPADDEAPSKELSKLRGIWVLESCQDDGKPYRWAGEQKLTFTADKLTWAITSEPSAPLFKKETFEFSTKYRLLQVQALAGIDRSPFTGDQAEGIYKVDKDKLTICWGVKKRPTEFSSQPGSLQRLEVWKRVKQ